MLKARVIPCLDVKDGRVVKGVNFLDLIDAGDPAEQAAFYDKEGADELCFLDINASHEGRETMLHVVSDVAAKCFIPLTVGGGVSNNDDIRKLLLAGADKAAINTAAVRDPDCVRRGAEKFGSQCIVVAMDARRAGDDYRIFTHGGRKETGIDAVLWAERMAASGAGELLVTSMDKDGTKKGFDVELLKRITSRVKIPVIASGGVGAPEHFAEAALEGGATGLLAASVFHFGQFSVADAKRAMAKAGVPVRLPGEAGGQAG